MGRRAFASCQENIALDTISQLDQGIYKAKRPGKAGTLVLGHNLRVVFATTGARLSSELKSDTMKRGGLVGCIVLNAQSWFRIAKEALKSALIRLTPRISACS